MEVGEGFVDMITMETNLGSLRRGKGNCWLSQHRLFNYEMVAVCSKIRRDRTRGNDRNDVRWTSKQHRLRRSSSTSKLLIRIRKAEFSDLAVGV